MGEIVHHNKFRTGLPKIRSFYICFDLHPQNLNKVQTYYIPANYSFLKGFTPYFEFERTKKGVTPFFDNCDDVLFMTKFHIFLLN